MPFPNRGPGTLVPWMGLLNLRSSQGLGLPFPLRRRVGSSCKLPTLSPELSKGREASLTTPIPTKAALKPFPHDKGLALSEGDPSSASLGNGDLASPSLPDQGSSRKLCSLRTGRICPPRHPVKWSLGAPAVTGVAGMLCWEGVLGDEVCVRWVASFRRTS